MIRALLFLTLSVTARADIGSWQFRAIRFEISHAKPYTGRVMQVVTVQPGKTGVFAMLKPVAVYGHNQAWSVTLVNHCPVDVPVSRAAILIEAPNVLALPNDIAKVRISQAYGRKGIWGKVVDATASVGSAALTASGVITKSKTQVIIAAGIGLVQLIVHLISNPPDPSMFFGDLLPPSVTVPALGGSDPFGVVSSTVDKHAKAIGPFLVASCP